MANFSFKFGRTKEVELLNLKTSVRIRITEPDIDDGFRESLPVNLPFDASGSYDLMVEGISFGRFKVTKKEITFSERSGLIEKTEIPATGTTHWAFKDSDERKKTKPEYLGFLIATK